MILFAGLSSSWSAFSSERRKTLGIVVQTLHKDGDPEAYKPPSENKNIDNDRAISNFVLSLFKLVTKKKLIYIFDQSRTRFPPSW